MSCGYKMLVTALACRGKCVCYELIVPDLVSYTLAVASDDDDDDEWICRARPK